MLVFEIFRLKNGAFLEKCQNYLKIVCFQIRCHTAFNFDILSPTFVISINNGVVDIFMYKNKYILMDLTLFLYFKHNFLLKSGAKIVFFKTFYLRLSL